MSGNRPTRRPYLYAVLLDVAGVVIAILLCTRGMSGLQESTQLLVPGTCELSLKKPGDYTIYHEHTSVMNGKLFVAGQSIDGLACTLVNKATGASIPLHVPGARSSYTIGARSGTSVLGFHLSEGGTYLLSAAYPDRASGPQAVLAVTGGTHKLFLNLLLGILVMTGSFIASAVLIVKTWLARRRVHAPPPPG